MSKKGIKQKLIYGLILLILTGGGYGVYTIVQYNQAQALHYDTAQTGILKHEVKVKATYANEEATMQSTSSGQLNLLVNEGQRVRRGDSVISIVPIGIRSNQSTVQAPIGGL